MPHYKVTVMLGETKLIAIVEADDRKDAADRIVNNLSSLPEDNPARQAYMEFAASSGHEGSFDVKVEDVPPPKPIREGRFLLQPSQKKPDWWVVTDTDNLIVITFEQARFHETQHITPLDDNPSPDPLILATALRECADWLRNYHYDILFKS